MDREREEFDKQQNGEESPWEPSFWTQRVFNTAFIIKWWFNLIDLIRHILCLCFQSGWSWWDLQPVKNNAGRVCCVVWLSKFIATGLLTCLCRNEFSGMHEVSLAQNWHQLYHGKRETVCSWCCAGICQDHLPNQQAWLCSFKPGSQWADTCSGNNSFRRRWSNLPSRKPRQT